MIKVAFVRHGITDWNLEKRIQGQSDTSLSEQGVQLLKARQAPSRFLERNWHASPLRRAVDTATLLSGFAEAEIRTDVRLKEMNWGEWEGEKLDDLRLKHGEAMAENERRGLYFRPTGGECPHMVKSRALSFLEHLSAAKSDAVVVTHKGVIRALMSHAFAWDMKSKPPVKPDWGRLHEFRFVPGGGLYAVEMNISLERNG